MTTENEFEPRPPEIAHGNRINAERDFITWSAEAIEGPMRTCIELNYCEAKNDLICEDGSLFSGVFSRSLNDAEELVIDNPQLKFELRRREIEYLEFRDMIKMMTGELPNTMVVLSDFPHELMDYTKDIGGYNTKRKQTMLRVIHKTEDNKIQIYSQNLDMSDRGALEAIYNYFDLEPEEGELLGQRIHLEIDSNQAEILVDHLVYRYDQYLKDNYGGEYYTGRILNSDADKLETSTFIESQQDIIDLAVQEIMHGNFEDRRYNTIALLAKRFEEYKYGNYSNTVIGDTEKAMRNSVLVQEREIYGRQAALTGKIWSACGSTITSAKELSSESVIHDMGYGNKISKEDSYGFDKLMYCVVCQAPPEEKEKEKWCGPCGLCKECDLDARGKG